MTYATKQESESVMLRKATPFENWLENELDRIAPHRLEMGSDMHAHLLYVVLQQLWEKQNAQKV